MYAWHGGMRSLKCKLAPMALYSLKICISVAIYCSWGRSSMVCRWLGSGSPLCQVSACCNSWALGLFTGLRICFTYYRAIQEQWFSFTCCNKFSFHLVGLPCQNSVIFLNVYHIIDKVAPLVHSDKLIQLSAFSTLLGQIWTDDISWWAWYHFHSKSCSKNKCRAQVWPDIEFCHASWGSAESYTFLYKLWASKWPSYATLLHRIKELPA